MYSKKLKSDRVALTEWPQLENGELFRKKFKSTPGIIRIIQMTSAPKLTENSAFVINKVLKQWT